MLFSSEKMNELSIKIKELVESSPVSELERNLHALFQGMLTKMDIVSREEFEIQAALLARTQQQLRALEEKIQQLSAPADAEHQK
ncbi:MAG TPA: accessory factor UbiK family protein [Methylophilus sp.]